MARGSCSSSPAPSAAPESPGGASPRRPWSGPRRSRTTSRTGPREFGIRVGDAEVDFAAVMARVRRIIDEGTALLRAAARGAWRRARPRARRASSRRTSSRRRDLRLTFAHALVATGSRPRALDVPGADRVPTVTSDDLMHVDGAAGSSRLRRRRRRLARVRPGVPPTGRRGDDRPARARTSRTARTRSSATCSRRTSRRRAFASSRARASSPSSSSTAGPPCSVRGGTRVVGDTILLAVGRQPVVDGLGLDEAGIAHDRGRRRRRPPPADDRAARLLRRRRRRRDDVHARRRPTRRRTRSRTCSTGPSTRARLPDDAARDLHRPRARGGRAHRARGPARQATTSRCAAPMSARAARRARSATGAAA